MWLYDKNHNKIEFLAHYKDRNIVSVLSSGDKTLNFSYPIKYAANIAEEGYIRTKTDEYVIKQTKTNGDYLEVIATLNVEELEGVMFDSFSTTYSTITDTLNLMLKDTGWKVGYCEVTKKRTIAGQYKNAWDLSQSCIDTYLCELEYDTINKLINVYEKRGSYKGVFIIDGVNMKDLEIQSSSYEFYTRLIPLGKDGLTIESVNNGKPYLENYQYSNKVKTVYWKDDRYTTASSLLEDATVKLDEISQPVKSYSMTIKDLAKISKKYKAYEFELGDTVLLVSKEKNVRLKHRIVKYTDYPENPRENKVEVSTTKITLETIQKKFNDTTTTVNTITNADGTIATDSIAGLNDLARDIEKKVDKVEGKGLSTNDFTDDYKNASHSHSNKDVLDTITEEDIDNWNNNGGGGSSFNILDAYPIGSIYMSVNSTSPETLFGGKWEQIKDRFLLACGDTYSNGATGGEATHKLTVDEMPAHKHSGIVYTGNAQHVSLSESGNTGYNLSWSKTGNSSRGDISTTNAGGSQAHNNMPPYLAVYMWKRTA